MALSLYLDDCAYSRLLYGLLQQAGHTVIRPSDAGLTGQDDAEHFAYAAGHGHVVLTKNPADFRALHEGCLARGDHHHGVVAVYQDNRSGDMNAGQIVAAIQKVEEVYRRERSGSQQPLADEFIELNHWR